MSEVLLVGVSVELAVGAAFGSRPLLPWGSLFRWTGATVLWAGAVYTTVMGAGLVARSLATPTLLVGASIVTLILVGVGRALSRDLEPLPTSRRWKELRRSGTVAEFILVGAAAALLAVQFAWGIWQALRFPLMAWDELFYHVPIVDVWLDRSQIVNVPQIGVLQGYPANGETFTTWLMAFSRTDALADATGLLFVPMLVLGTALTARRLGARSWTAVFVALCFASVPAVFLGMTSAYVDVPATAMGIAAIGLTIAAARKTRPSLESGASIGKRGWYGWAVAGMATGLAAGTKSPALVYTTVVFVALLPWSLAIILRNRRDRAAPRRFVETALVPWVFGVTSLLFGGYWYVRNIVLHRNPLYPFAFGPFDGPLDRSVTLEIGLDDWFDRLGEQARVVASWGVDIGGHPVYPHDIRPGGFGAAWLILALPAIVALVVVLVRRRRYLDLMIAVVAVGATWLAIPPKWYARLTLLLIAIGYAAFGVIMSLSVLTHRYPRPRDRPDHGSRSSSPRSAPALVSIATVGLTAMLLLTILSAYRVVRFGNYPYTTDLSPGNVLTFAEVRELSLQASSGLVHAVKPWSGCAAITGLPTGSTLATDETLFSHVAVGPKLERHLAEPLTQHDDLSSLLTEIAQRGADYVSLASDSPNVALAVSAPDRLHLIAKSVCPGGLALQNVYRVDG